MLNEQTLHTLNALKLFGMARSFGDKIVHPSSADLSQPEFFGLIVQDEKTYRDNLRLKRLLLNAKLTQPACLEDIDYKHPRGLNKQTILEPCSTDWISRHHTVLLTGKSHLAQAIGLAAIHQGYRVLYRETHTLLEEIAEAAIDGTRKQHMQLLTTVPLLIIDDLGMRKLPSTAAEDLLDIVMRRYKRASTLLTSKRPVEDWGNLW
jgi:DNA replication protein DnaC